MRFHRLICRGAALCGALTLVPATAFADQASAATALPTLLAKNWAIGYALVFLAILLGLLALLIPSMRKALRKKD